MKILLTNDDSIFSKGISALAEVLVEFGDVYVIAPNRERSACSHSITLDHPLRIYPNDFSVKVKKAVAVNGTPVDCVKLALTTLLDAKPDLVVSGINKGPNMTVDIFYSGTVAAAYEGLFGDVAAIAVSLATYVLETDYTSSKFWVNKFLKTFLDKILASENRCVYNINIPYLPADQIKGMKITKLGRVRYKDSYQMRFDPLGKPYYWLSGEPEILEYDEDSDILSVKNGYVSITPLAIERTDLKMMQYLKENIKL